MKKVFFLLNFLVCILGVNAQDESTLFRSLKLGFEGGRTNLDEFPYYPRMQIEGNNLYVCTYQGVYSKDLAKDSSWELVGFHGESIIEFVREESNMLALVNSDKERFLLISHDNGVTFADYTSDYFKKYQSQHIYRLAQSPVDPKTIITLSLNNGLSRSNDFGANWECLNDESLGYYISFAGYHPLDPSLIYYNAETSFFEGNILFSYDSGATWNRYRVPGGDNCIHQIAFHPTYENIWVFGGEGIAGKTIDKGKTWKITDFYQMEDKDNYWGAYFYNTIFDIQNPDILYMAGCINDRDGNDVIKILCSIDCGETWQMVLKTPVNEKDAFKDMVQYNDKLILYFVNDVYEINKSDLLQNVSLVNNIESNSKIKIVADGIKEMFCFETDLSVSEVTLINLTGKMMQCNKIDNKDYSIDVSRLQNGMYLAVFYCENETIVKKIIKE